MDSSADGPTRALSAPALRGITRLSATDTVRARIALAIELGLLAPGEQLPPDADIAEALGVSEITARRALKSLADEGVLLRRRGRTGGTFVPEDGGHQTVAPVAAYRADADKVRRLIDERTLIECTIAHYAAIDVTEQAIGELRGHVASMRSAATWAEYHAADERFHLGVARASGQDWAIPRYTEALHGLYKYFLPYPIGYLHGVNDEHADLVDALEARDPVRAVEITRRHVSVLHETMFVGLDHQGIARPPVG